MTSSHIRLAHTHTTRPATELPAIYAVSCREMIQTGYFCATAGEAQEADYKSELKSAWSSSFCSQQRAGCQRTLPAVSSRSPASLLPLQLTPTHLPQTLFFSCTVLSDHFVLVYEINLCILQGKQKLSGFVGFCGYWGTASTSACRSCTQSLLPRSYNVV